MDKLDLNGLIEWRSSVQRLPLNDATEVMTGSMVFFSDFQACARIGIQLNNLQFSSYISYRQAHNTLNFSALGVLKNLS